MGKDDKQDSGKGKGSTNKGGKFNEKPAKREVNNVADTHPPPRKKPTK